MHIHMQEILYKLFLIVTRIKISYKKLFEVNPLFLLIERRYGDSELFENRLTFHDFRAIMNENCIHSMELIQTQIINLYREYVDSNVTHDSLLKECEDLLLNNSGLQGDVVLHLICATYHVLKLDPSR